MIHLDTNVLIAAGDALNVHHQAARNFLSAPGVFAASTVVWMEFVSKPLPPVLVEAARHLLKGGLLPFDEETAVLAGELYFRAGSRRRTRMDSMIAATAIRSGAELATTNRDDFAPFLPLGLKLVAAR